MLVKHTFLHYTEPRICDEFMKKICNEHKFSEVVGRLRFQNYPCETYWKNPIFTFIFSVLCSITPRNFVIALRMTKDKKKRIQSFKVRMAEFAVLLRSSLRDWKFINFRNETQTNNTEGYCWSFGWTLSGRSDTRLCQWSGIVEGACRWATKQTEN